MDTLELRKQAAVLRLQAIDPALNEDARRSLIQLSEDYEARARTLEMSMAGSKPLKPPPEE